MPVRTSSLALGTTPTSLFNASHNRRRFVIQNTDTEAVYVGGSDVDTTTGHEIPVDGVFEVVQSFPTDASAKYQWYGISSTGGITVRILEVTG